LPISDPAGIVGIVTFHNSHFRMFLRRPIDSRDMIKPKLG
jgi:hypothetical protein